MRKHEWIAVRLNALGKRPGGLARHLSVDSARVSEIISGKRKVQRHEAQPLADYLDLSLGELHQFLDNPPLDKPALEAFGEEVEHIEKPADTAGNEGGMPTAQLRNIHTRIKALLAPLDADTAGQLVDRVILEKAEEEEARNRPRDRA